MNENRIAGTNPGCGNQEWDTGTKPFYGKDHNPIVRWEFEIEVVVCILEHLAPLLRDADNVHPEYARMAGEACNRAGDTLEDMRQEIRKHNGKEWVERVRNALCTEEELE